MSTNNIENANTNEIKGKTLDLISARDLQRLNIPEPNIIVEDMLYQGLAILAGPPKLGKSWLSLDLGISIATGQPFLGHKTNEGVCIYLALEDSKNRLKRRLNQISNNQDASNNFFLTIMAESIETGLLEQLNNAIISHPNTKLIIIDTLQKVRGSMKYNQSAYEYDYKEIAKLKQFADKHGICILLIHHLRKAKDTEDVFNRISGTNGIAGATDTMIVLSKTNRSNSETLFSITGRDVESYEEIVQFDKSSFKWKTLHSGEELLKMQEAATYDNDPAIITIKQLLKQMPKGFEMTSSELFKKIFEITGSIPRQKNAAGLTKHINALKYKLMQNDNIYYCPPNPNGGSNGRKMFFSIPNKNNEKIERDNKEVVYDKFLGYQ